VSVTALRALQVRVRLTSKERSLPNATSLCWRA